MEPSGIFASLSRVSFLSFSDRKRCLYKRPCFFLYIFPRTSSFFSVCFFSPLFTLEVIHQARNTLGHIPREGAVLNRQNHLLTSTSDHNGEPLLERTPRNASLDFPKASTLFNLPPTSSYPFFHSSRLDHLRLLSIPLQKISIKVSSSRLEEREQRVTNKEHESTSREHSKRKHSKRSLCIPRLGRLKTLALEYLIREFGWKFARHVLYFSKLSKSRTSGCNGSQSGLHRGLSPCIVDPRFTSVHREILFPSGHCIRIMNLVKPSRSSNLMMPNRWAAVRIGDAVSRQGFDPCALSYDIKSGSIAMVLKRMLEWKIFGSDTMF